MFLVFDDCNLMKQKYKLVFYYNLFCQVWGFKNKTTLDTASVFLLAEVVNLVINPLECWAEFGDM
jgi:hypothetical protein